MKFQFYFKKNKIICTESINDSKNFLVGRKLIAKNIKVESDQISRKNFDLSSLI